MLRRMKSHACKLGKSYLWLYWFCPPPDIYLVWKPTNIKSSGKDFHFFSFFFDNQVIRSPKELGGWVGEREKGGVCVCLLMSIRCRLTFQILLIM